MFLFCIDINFYKIYNANLCTLLKTVNLTAMGISDWSQKYGYLDEKPILIGKYNTGIVLQWYEWLFVFLCFCTHHY